jgi:hypothetical protein
LTYPPDHVVERSVEHYFYGIGRLQAGTLKWFAAEAVVLDDPRNGERTRQTNNSGTREDWRARG